MRDMMYELWSDKNKVSRNKMEEKVMCEYIKTHEKFWSKPIDKILEKNWTTDLWFSEC